MPVSLQKIGVQAQNSCLCIPTYTQHYFRRSNRSFQKISVFHKTISIVTKLNYQFTNSNSIAIYIPYHTNISHKIHTNTIHKQTPYQTRRLDRSKSMPNILVQSSYQARIVCTKLHSVRHCFYWTSPYLLNFGKKFARRKDGKLTTAKIGHGFTIRQFIPLQKLRPVLLYDNPYHYENWEPICHTTS